MLALAACVVAVQPGSAEALSRPPHPVILVHGLASDAGTWAGLSQFLVAQGWQFGGTSTFIPATLGVTPVSAGHFYAMNFSDHNAGTFRSQNLSLDRQGYELAAVIQAVLTANPGAQKVILVAHSMGGLAAREYLQGLARLNPSAARIPYRGDVARLIAIGTPHLGSPLAALCQSLPSACLEAFIDPASTALAELVPGSPALSTLNNVAASPLPLDVVYDSIAGLGGVGLGGDGDGVVPRASQEFLAVVPGLTHRLREFLVQDRSDCGTTLVFVTTVVFGEVHTCEPGDAGVLGAALDAVLQPRLALSLNTSALSTGDTVALILDVQTGFPDPENIGDVYLGVVVPDGSIYMATPTGLALAVTGGVVVPGGVQPLRSNTVLSSGAETLFSGPISTPIPAGPYTFFALLVRAGTTPGDTSNWLSNLAQVSFTFQ
jgi:pimeloyl-ACP methyl ester carboxylesterase